MPIAALFMKPHERCSSESSNTTLSFVCEYILFGFVVPVHLAGDSEATGRHEGTPGCTKGQGTCSVNKAYEVLYFYVCGGNYIQYSPRCMYIYIYIYMHICMCVCMYVCMCVCTYNRHANESLHNCDVSPDCHYFYTKISSCMIATV